MAFWIKLLMMHENKKSEAIGEFKIIDRYFSHIGKPVASEVLLSVGDDAAVVACDPQAMVLTVDTLVSGVHFYPDDPPESIAHKALAVNLSDLAAMGATPFAFLLSLTLPTVDEAWIVTFSNTLNAQALHFNVTLIGGDTTRGPLAVSITALGRVNRDYVLKRQAAKIGDDIYVTDELGWAAFYVYAKAHHQDPNDRATNAYLYPEPNIGFGARLCGLAHAAIDVSDGLFADLSHILAASGVGAQLVREHIPIAAAWDILPVDEAFYHAVTGGDDYVLCFTAPKSAAVLLKMLSETAGVKLSKIGEIVEGKDITLDGIPWKGEIGFEHFK